MSENSINNNNCDTMQDAMERECSPNVREDTNAVTSASEKGKKKKFKSFDFALRDVPLNATLEEKLHAVCQKYSSLIHDNKELTLKLKQQGNTLQSVIHERDQLQSEKNRILLQKDKLETLSRELQKQNKVIQDESLARTRAEEEKRKEVADRFQISITGIQEKLSEYQVRNTELRKENQELADKLTDFIKQHEQREEHVNKVLKTRDLEVKLAEAKLNKSQCLLDQERIKFQHQIVKLEEEAKLMKNRMEMHLQLEEKLKEQIEFYKTKYHEFNKTMADSNKTFDNAKKEMEKLGKRILTTEREAIEWRGKWEVSQRSLLELVSSHTHQSEELSAARKQVDRLGGLCRALQSQLAELRQSATSGVQNGQISPDAANSISTTDLDDSNGVNQSALSLAAQVASEDPHPSFPAVASVPGDARKSDPASMLQSSESNSANQERTDESNV